MKYDIRCKLSALSPSLAAMFCVACTLWFAASPVERDWSHTDVALTYAGAVLTLTGVILISVRNKRLSPSRLDIVLLAWFLYAMARAYFDASYPCSAFCLRTTQMMMLYVALRLLLTSTAMREEYIVLPLVLFGLWEAWLGLGQLVQAGSRHHLYLLTGSFLNPGPYSAILAMGLVMAVYWHRKCSHCKYLYLPASVFAILLPATWSRAALLSVAVCVGIIYWNEWKRWRWLVAASGIVAGFGLYFIKAGSADGRYIIYLISILNIMHHPILGGGIGSFFHQYAEGMARFSQGYPDFNFRSADVLDYAFNDLLRIGVEQGCVGIAFAIAVIILTYRALRSRGPILWMGLSALLIFSFFSYPFELVPYQIIMVLILSYAGTSEQASIQRCKMAEGLMSEVNYELSFSLKPSSLILHAVMLITFPVSIFIGHQIGQRAEAAADYRMMAGVNHADFIDDYYELLPLMASNGHFLFDFAKILAAERRYNDSNAMLRRGTLVSNDPMFYVLQGNNYREMEAYSEAEESYKKAYFILPNRIYPLYQLMCLYEQRGMERKMRQMARQIINFKVKVESPATEEIKARAIQVTDSLNRKYRGCRKSITE